jgi:hypothetical protein
MSHPQYDKGWQFSFNCIFSSSFLVRIQVHENRLSSNQKTID